jgi:hypothetical protein
MNTQNHVTTELELFSVYHDLELTCNTQINETPSGRHSIVIDDHWDFGRLAIIDEFVRKVLTSNDVGYIETTGSTGRITWVPQRWIEPYRRAVTAMISPEMHERFDVRNVFVDLFLHACDELKILDWSSHALGHYGAKREANALAFNELIATIRRLSKKRPYPSQIWHAENDHRNNFDSCVAFIDRLFSDWSRYAVVRVDLEYLKEHASDVFTLDARTDMARLLNRMRHGKRVKMDCRERELFADAAGYIWKLEYGEDRLLHFHCFFFFKKKNGAQAGYWAQQIGQYWVDVITEGRGFVHNCNFKWYGHPDEGIGEVNRNDTSKREKLVGAVGYLFKPEQCLPIRKSDPRWRTFGKGRL